MDSFAQAFSDSPFHLVHLTEKINNLISQPKPSPCSFNAKEAAIEAYDHLRCHHYLSESVALVRLLSKPHIKSLLLCHDAVANKAYLPIVADVPDGTDEGNIVIKIVTLVKGHNPLGLTLKVHKSTGSITVAQVLSGSVAERTGAIDIGDEVVEINGILVCNRNLLEIVNTLQTMLSDSVRFKLVPACCDVSKMIDNGSIDQEVYVRTLSTYDPDNDSSPSCPECRLPFEPGEILRITKVRGSHWLEATKVEVMLKGPISPGFRPSRYQMVFGRTGLVRRQSPEHRNQSMGDAPNGGGEPNQRGNACLYEEVVRYYPEDGFYRPIILIGPPGVGKTELVHQLINTDPDHFREPIRITTRSPRPGELHGVDFLFVTDEEFNTFVEAESLIDQSVQSEGGRIGLCVDAVLEIIQGGQVAVFEGHYDNLYNIRSALIKPLIVLVKPPCLEVLLETRQLRGAIQEEQSNYTRVSGAGSTMVYSVPSTPRIKPFRRHDALSGASTPTHTTTDNTIAGIRSHYFLKSNLTKGAFEENELHEMLEVAAQLERTHQHFADFVLINDDLPVALEKLSEWAYRIEGEAMWVPRKWIESKEYMLEEINNDPTLCV